MVTRLPNMDRADHRPPRQGPRLAPLHPDGRLGRTTDPIVVARAQGAWLEDVDGRRYIDGNASWYVATLGHGHPRLLRSPRVAGADAGALLAGGRRPRARRRASPTSSWRSPPPGLTRVFYVDDGSAAIDAAVKMCAQAWQQLGAPSKKRFVALDGAFHGDTIGAVSLGGVDVFRRPFAGVTFECVHAPFPEPAAYEQAVAAVERLLRSEADSIAAVFVEPVSRAPRGCACTIPRFCATCARYARSTTCGWSPTKSLRGTGAQARCGRASTPAYARFHVHRQGVRCPRAHGCRPGDRSRLRRPSAAAASAPFFTGTRFAATRIGAALAREVLAIYRDERVLDQVARKAPRHRPRLRNASRELPGVARVRAAGMIGAADLGRRRRLPRGASAGGSTTRRAGAGPTCARWAAPCTSALRSRSTTPTSTRCCRFSRRACGGAGPARPQR